MHQKQNKLYKAQKILITHYMPAEIQFHWHDIIFIVAVGIVIILAQFKVYNLEYDYCLSIANVDGNAIINLNACGDYTYILL